jgi:hypothetical protein
MTQDPLVEAFGDSLYRGQITKFELSRQTWSLSIHFRFLYLYHLILLFAYSGLYRSLAKGEYVGYAERELDRYVKLRTRSGEKRRHWIYGDWRKGFPHSVAPTGRDWALEVEELALQIRTPVVLLIAEE